MRWLEGVVEVTGEEELEDEELDWPTIELEAIFNVEELVDEVVEEEEEEEDEDEEDDDDDEPVKPIELEGDTT